MRSIDAPEEDPKYVYELCVNSISDKISLENNFLRDRLSMVSNEVAMAAIIYSEYGLDHQLYNIPPNNCEDKEIVIGSVTKKELKDVYSKHMVGKNKPAREKIYDLLLSRAPIGRCPYCGIGDASTLDHYLPKAIYPILSVVPKNLVPSCKDCNTGKKASIASSSGTQCLHPYFDNQEVVSEQWIFAKIESTSPEVVIFYVCAPSHWDNTLKKRVESHFNDFNLARRFSIEAANELANKKYSWDETEKKFGMETLISILSSDYNSCLKKHVNSWRTAFYQAFHDHYLVLHNKMSCM